MGLRYKHTKEFANMVEEMYQFNPFANMDNTINVNKTKKETFYIDSKLNEGESDRFIRAMNFPPYDPAVIVSQLDQCEYFVETMQQYIQYLQSIGANNDWKND